MAQKQEGWYRQLGRGAPFWLVALVANFLGLHPCPGSVGGRSSQEKQRDLGYSPAKSIW